MKIKNYTVFDIETPNKENNSISSISIVNVKDGNIVLQKEYLVNPEEKFDDFNIELTGITPENVKEAPTFDKVWEEIKQFFTNGIVIIQTIAKLLEKIK